MSESKKRARMRERPVLPDPPFLCSHCRHGTMVIQKLQAWMLTSESWQHDTPEWFWRVTCKSPKVTPWKFTVFCHPVVDCDAFRAREVLTTEELARERAKRDRKRDKKKKKKRKNRK